MVGPVLVTVAAPSTAKLAAVPREGKLAAACACRSERAAGATMLASKSNITVMRERKILDRSPLCMHVSPSSIHFTFTYT
jgi:hypothetical protein